MPADIVIYALVAAGLVLWLRNILGTRHGDEAQRPNPFTPHTSEKTDIAAHDAAPRSEAAGAGEITDIENALPRNMGIEGAEAKNGLQSIARQDRSFELNHFLSGAQDAFAMIVEAFAAGDRETLKNLLSEPVYKSFDAALTYREKEGQTASTEIHAIRRTEILDAQVRNKTAFITVRFVADETNVIYDKSGNAISGNPDRVTETIDIWTFGRPLRSKSPAWLVYETRDEDAYEHDHKTVPDSE